MNRSTKTKREKIIKSIAKIKLKIRASWVGAPTPRRGRDQISNKDWTNKKNFIRKNTKTKRSPILRRRRSNQQLNLTMNWGKELHE
jgi:hypothetical protein